MLNNFAYSKYKNSLVFLFLLILTLLLRIASLNYLDASDNYNDVAYKALLENGHSCYRYSNLTTFITLFLLKFIHFSSLALKLPSIIYSTATIIFIYLAVSKISNKVAFLSIFLFAISPWSIVVSRMTRDYAFDAMFSSIAIYGISIIFFRKEKNKTLDHAIDLAYLALMVLLLYLLTKLNNRSHTLIIALFPLSTTAIPACKILLSANISKTYKVLIPTILFSIGAASFFLFDYANFIQGVRFDLYYLRVFFDSSIKSPWQWFYRLNSTFFSWLLILLFVFPLIVKQQKSPFIISLYISFLTGIIFFVFKFETHLSYSPTRYVYFLFPLYVIIISNATCRIVDRASRLSKAQWAFSILIFILFLRLMNIQALNYAIFPHKAYAKEGRGTIYADNLGIGLFQMEEVIDYLRRELEWSEDKTFVFGGRYCEFILLLDYPIDKDRCLERDTGAFYDVGENMFVESQYFNYHELAKAIRLNEKGFLVTKDKYLTDSKHNRIIELKKDDILFDGENLLFLKNINGFNIYKWN